MILLLLLFFFLLPLLLLFPIIIIVVVVIIIMIVIIIIILHTTTFVVVVVVLFYTTTTNNNVVVLLFPIIDHNPQHCIRHHCVGDGCTRHRGEQHPAAAEPLNNGRPFVREPIVQYHRIAHNIACYRAHKLDRGFGFGWRRRWHAGTLIVLQHLGQVNRRLVVVDLTLDRALWAEAAC